MKLGIPTSLVIIVVISSTNCQFPDLHVRWPRRGNFTIKYGCPPSPRTEALAQRYPDCLYYCKDGSGDWIYGFYSPGTNCSDENGREVIQLSLLQRELPAFDDASASCELRTCTRDQSTLEGNEPVRKTRHPKYGPEKRPGSCFFGSCYLILETATDVTSPESTQISTVETETTLSPPVRNETAATSPVGDGPAPALQVENEATPTPTL